MTAKRKAAETRKALLERIDRLKAALAKARKKSKPKPKPKTTPKPKPKPKPTPKPKPKPPAKAPRIKRRKREPGNPDFHPTRERPPNPNRKRRKWKDRGKDIGDARDTFVERFDIPEDSAEKLFQPPADAGWSIADDSTAAADYWARIYGDRIKTVIFHPDGSYTVFTSHGNAMVFIQGRSGKAAIEAVTNAGSTLAVVRIGPNGEILDTLWERSFDDYASDTLDGDLDP